MASSTTDLGSCHKSSTLLGGYVSDGKLEMFKFTLPEVIEAKEDRMV
jgi:hypothetical protein